jgi:glycine/sarcosine/betaine reductase complex component A
LAGEAMHLRVFHIIEPKIKEQIDSKIFEDHLGVMEMALKVDEITQGMNRVRNGNL